MPEVFRVFNPDIKRFIIIHVSQQIEGVFVLIHALKVVVTFYVIVSFGLESMEKLSCHIHVGPVTLAATYVVLIVPRIHTWLFHLKMTLI